MESLKSGTLSGRANAGPGNNIMNILESRKPVINEKLKRCREFKYSDPKPPRPYTENTPKEELVLEHCIQFKKQFQQHTDESRELFIYPKNECDVYKIICTTVRPTKLGFLELYDYQECAERLSRFVTYEELDPPDEFPKCIPSPANVSRWQKGDSFDISILLTSLLIGVGYDAYCVYGIAPKEITTKNQALMECPYLQKHLIPEEQEDKKDEETLGDFVKITKRKKIESEFDTKKEEKQIREREEMARKALTIDDDEPDETPPDLYIGRRIHCWVLVKKGKRGVTQDVFVEPSTGRCHSTKESPYLLVDAVFNHLNFFIHMQPKHRVQDIKFDLYQTMAWEYVMLQDQVFRNAGDQEGPDIQQQGNMNKLQSEEQKIRQLAQTLDMPPTWCPKVYLDKDAFIKGSPLGESTTFYVKVKMERYSDYSQQDGLVEKFTIYEDYKKLKVQEIRYFYKHRSDKLVIKRHFPFLFKTIEHYDPGKKPHWKQVTTADRRIRIIKYYPNRNEDGLIKRIQKIGQKTVEYYHNRDDKIISRSIRFVKSDGKKKGGPKDYNYDDNHIGDVRITKMTQKFERNHKVPANEQISKLVIDLVKYRVQAIYHMEEGEISPVIHDYSRDQILGIAKNDDKKTDDPVIQHEHETILGMEKECYQYMKMQEATVADQNRFMRSTVILEKTLHDKARQKFKQNMHKDSDNEQEEDTNDYLRPFLQKRGLNKTGVLDAQVAMQIKTELQKKLKQRIIARAKIITERLRKQQETLKKQEQHYQKKQEERNQKELANLKFKIKILESRSERFEFMAKQKLHDMEQTLKNDPRMSAIKDKK